MKNNLKRDQIHPHQVDNWLKNFAEEEKLTMNLKVHRFYLNKKTYQILAGANENRIRIYLGIEKNKEQGKYRLCAFAVSAFLLGSGEVYIDYESPVFKLGIHNEDFSSKTNEVIECIRLYRSWRNGEIETNSDSNFRKYIYPNAYLLTKYELHDVFNLQNHENATIDFGIAKAMHIMISTEKVISGENVPKDTLSTDVDSSPVFDYGTFCPPQCDEGSIYNS